jgi:LytS/YehU family sensor histidine kinase
MEYILYDAKEPKIRLLKEVNYIQNHIDIEKLRFGNKVSIQINLQRDIEAQYAPPLLFLPFIENCFKHGAVENNRRTILIDFELTNKNILIFSVSTNYNLFTHNKKIVALEIKMF